MSKLDKTQPYGEVSGVMECGTRYFQGNKRFDVNGDEITETVADADATKGKPGRKSKAETVAAADVSVDEQLSAQLSE